MVVDARQWQIVDTFRDDMIAMIESRLSLSACEQIDRPDRRELLSRWALESHYWLELAIRPYLLQIRVGLMTDDALRSEDLRTMIEDSGYTLQEYVGLGLASVGCDWPVPPVEHYREQADRYRLATPVDLRQIEQLDDDHIRHRIISTAACYLKVFDGSAAM